MSDWKDICREKNGSDVCDSAEACSDCTNRAAQMSELTPEAVKAARDAHLQGCEGLENMAWDMSTAYLALKAERDALAADAGKAYLQSIASMGQASEAYQAQLAVEAERDALATKLAEAEGALNICSAAWGECNRILDETKAKLARAERAAELFGGPNWSAKLDYYSRPLATLTEGKDNG